MADDKNMPGIRKSGDTGFRPPMESGKTGEKPKVHRTGDTHEPHRESTPQGEMPETHKTGE